MRLSRFAPTLIEQASPRRGLLITNGKCQQPQQPPFVLRSRREQRRRFEACPEFIEGHRCSRKSTGSAGTWIGPGNSCKVAT